MRVGRVEIKRPEADFSEARYRTDNDLFFQLVQVLDREEGI